MIFRVGKSSAAQIEALETGVIAVGMQTRAFSGDVRFSSYAGGIIDEPDLCALNTTNHAVVMMSYVERQPSLGNYFKLRNSWGDDWGENGYGWIRIYDHIGLRGCGLLEHCFQPKNLKLVN